jgi:hypothetical protein
MAQEAPPPSYYAPPPQAYPPQPYPPQPYPPQAYPPQAYAAPPPAPGYHEHDGFYLRCLPGLGYLHNSTSSGGSTVKISGVAGTFGLAIGGVVTPNLVIYGEVLDTMASNPTVDIDGQSYSGSGSIDLIGIGPGVAYYFGSNSYLSATLLFSKLQVSDNNGNNPENASDMGVGGSGTFGQEWWVGHDWGIGVAGQLTLASMKVSGGDSRWTSLAASLLFSATYN